mmetsp:Transcript_26817/g.88002  ORF Transcript_26817/g.88002 Transcript_26817/m.88002 type:complete len:213 (-) Transcript_26817:302-940(-)
MASVSWSRACRSACNFRWRACVSKTSATCASFIPFQWSFRTRVYGLSAETLSAGCSIMCGSDIMNACSASFASFSAAAAAASFSFLLAASARFVAAVLTVFSWRAPESPLATSFWNVSCDRSRAAISASALSSYCAFASFSDICAWHHAACCACCSFLRSPHVRSSPSNFWSEETPLRGSSSPTRAGSEFFSTAGSFRSNSFVVIFPCVALR